MRRTLQILWLVCSGGCARAPAPELHTAPVPCALGDNYAGDWVFVDGSRADPARRMRLTQAGERWEAVVLEGERRLRFAGERAGRALRLTELGEAGGSLRRLYASVHAGSCSLRVVEVAVRGDVERPLPGGYAEFLPFPAGADLSWALCDAAALVRPAGPGRYAVSVESDPAADGDARCAYAFDLFANDHAVARDLAPRSRRGARVWEGSVEIPYAGDHLIEIHRHRACAGEPPALVGVACARVAQP